MSKLIVFKYKKNNTLTLIGAEICNFQISKDATQQGTNSRIYRMYNQYYFSKFVIQLTNVDPINFTIYSFIE